MRTPTIPAPVAGKAQRFRGPARAGHAGGRLLQDALGTASALFGRLLFLAGSLVTPLTGVLGYETLLPMALLMFGFLSAAALLAAVSARG